MSSIMNARGLETVLYEKKRSTAYVTLNRPTVLNALNRAAIADCALHSKMRATTLRSGA